MSVQNILSAYNQGAAFTVADGGYIDMDNEENKLLKVANENKGTTGVEGRLQQQAMADGVSVEQVKALVAKVLERLSHTGTGRRGNAFGVAHKASDRHAAIKDSIKNRVI